MYAAGSTRMPNAIILVRQSVSVPSAIDIGRLHVGRMGDCDPSNTSWRAFGAYVVRSSHYLAIDGSACAHVVREHIEQSAFSFGLLEAVAYLSILKRWLYGPCRSHCLQDIAGTMLV